MDLSKLSDEELDALEAKAKAPQPVSLEHLSDADLEALEQKAKAAAAPPENQHELLPYLKSAGTSMMDQVKAGAAGLGHAVMHPIDTAKEVGSAVGSLVTDPAGTAEAVNRTVRNIPLVGPAVTNAEANLKGIGADIGQIVHGRDGPAEGPAAHDEFLRQQAESDEAHAKAHPLTDFIQKSAGYALPVGAVAQTAGATIDAFKQSLAEGNSPYEALQDARNTAALFGLAHGATRGAGAAGKAALTSDFAGKVGKVAAKGFAGVHPETIDRYIANPEAVNSAPKLLDTTKNLIQHMEDNRGEQSAASGASYRLLENSPPASPADFAGPIQGALDDLQTRGKNYGPERKSAAAHLQSLQDEIAGNVDDNGELTKDHGKSIMTQLWQSYKDAKDPLVRQAYKAAATGIDDFLKSSEPEYKAAMDELSKDTVALKGVQDAYHSDNGTLQGLKRIQGGKDPFQDEALGRYDKRNGTNFREDLANARANDAFQKSNIHGSRGVNMFRGVGEGLEKVAGPVAAAPVRLIAGPIGALSDLYGGRVVKGMIDAGIKLNKLAGTPYAKVLAEAAQGGPQSLAVAHYTLSQKDPAYQATQQDDN